MTSVETSGACRITVIGPDGKADLAVPVESTVSALLPTLRRYVVKTSGDDEPQGDTSDASWVLQRLGEDPFDVAGTPESLDWLEGEEFHLRPAGQALPELHFDDLADGIAESVERRWDRWRPDFRRPFFLVLSAIAVCVVALTLLTDGATEVRMGSVGVLGLALLAGAVAADIKLADRTLALLAALGSCGFAGLAGIGIADGAPDAVVVNTVGLIGASCGLLIASAVVIVLQSFYAKKIPKAPFLLLALVSVASIMGFWLWLVIGLTPARAAGVTAVVFFIVVLFVPKMVIKFAHLRGPQLPKTTDELTFDIEPVPAPEARNKTMVADQYLSVFTTGSALAASVSFWYLIEAPTWAGWALTLLVGAGMLLRARTFLGLWQRAAMTIAGGTATVLLLERLWSISSPGWQIVVLLGLLTVLGALLAAVRRPPPRRLLPIWEHIANVLDTVTALAALPVLLQVLGVYTWARGLFG